MVARLFFLSICLPFLLTSCQQSKKTVEFVDYVNPLMGTESTFAFSHGNTYPAVAVPWGMNFWSPQTGENGSGWMYTYADSLMRGFRQKKRCAPAMRHRCVEWSCPANFYPDFSVWAENCWGINVVASMESLISDIIIDTEDPDRALADLARSYQRTTMRKHTKGGYANVLDELWVVCKQYNADMVLMYDQISCKGMDGLRGVFEEQAAARGVHMLWVAQDLLDSRTISKRDMRRQVNLYMQTVMGEEPVRPDLVDFDDALTW